MGALDWLDDDYRDVIRHACTEPELVTMLMEREASYELSLVASMSKDPAVLILMAGWGDPETMNAVANNHAAPEEAVRRVYETALRYWGSTDSARYVLVPLRANHACPADLAERIDKEIER